MNSTPKALTFNVLIQRQNGAFVGHCIETGLVATALDEQDVLAKMGKLLQRQITFAMENNRLADIYHFAPKEIVDAFLTLEERLIQKKSTPLWKDSKPWFTLEQNAYAAVC